MDYFAIKIKLTRKQYEGLLSLIGYQLNVRAQESPVGNNALIVDHLLEICKIMQRKLVNSDSPKLTFKLSRSQGRALMMHWQTTGESDPYYATLQNTCAAELDRFFKQPINIDLS